MAHHHHPLPSWGQKSLSFTASHVVSLLVHDIMRECGYIATSIDMEAPQLATIGDLCIINYYHPDMNNFECTIIMKTFGDEMEMRVIHRGQIREIALDLYVSGYTPDHMKNLQGLVEVMWYGLLHDLRLAALELLGVPWHQSELPEVWLIVLKLQHYRLITNFERDTRGIICEVMDNFDNTPQHHYFLTLHAPI